MRSNHFDDITHLAKQLKDISHQYNIAARALQGIDHLCATYNGDRSIIDFDTTHYKRSLWYQKLIIQSGVTLNLEMYINTRIQIFAEEEVGYYDYLTDLQGEAIDDRLTCGEAQIALNALPDEDFFTFLNDEEIAPNREVDGILPEIAHELRLLSQMSQEQMLFERAKQHCLKWLNDHPQWAQEYPRSFVTQSRWSYPRHLAEYPEWWQPYPPISLFNNADLKVHVDRQEFCFEHSSYSQPFIITSLILLAVGYQIGSYYFCTNLDGSIVKELTDILPWPFSY